ncbi:MAG: zf-TFIIB domain-containing protein [Candidatus Hydrogenedentes bacterium]|nr:zf-TFIIB domain-containing protein [Candidatus Hydrogenedentota bacterium]
MNSPVADTPLITVELDEIEIDVCPVSGGIWLDQGELELLFDDPHAATAMLNEAQAVAGAADRKLSCPVSGQAMTAYRLGENPPVVVDCSPYGIWFDKGELDTILKSAGASKRVEHLRAFLHSFFRHEQKEQANHAE